MFKIKRKYENANNLCTRKAPNESFSIPKTPTAKKVAKKKSRKNIKSGYVKDNSSDDDEISSWSSIEESSSCSSIEENRNAVEEFAIMDALSTNESFTERPQIDVQSFDGEFQPYAESTPKRNLEIEHQLSDLSEEEEIIGEDFIRDNLPSIVEELQPIIASERFHIPNLLDDVTVESEGEKEIHQVEDTEDQDLPLNELQSASKTFKNSDSNKKRSKRKTETSFELLKKNQSNEISGKQRHSTGNHLIQDGDYQNSTPKSLKSTRFKMGPKKLYESDHQLYEEDSVPRKKYVKKKITKSILNSRAKNQPRRKTISNRTLEDQILTQINGEGSAEVLSQNSSPANNYKTLKQRLSHLTSEKSHTQNKESQNHYPTSLKDIGCVTNRRSFKTLGYCTQNKNQNLPICDIITVKDRLSSGMKHTDFNKTFC